MESEDDLEKLFGNAEDDSVKPIDIGVSPQPDLQNGSTQPEELSPETPLQNEPSKKPEDGIQGPDDDRTEQYLKDELDADYATSIEDLESGERNFAQKGDFLDLTEKKPQLKKIKIGVGWDQKNMEEDPIDLDASIFLLNRDDKTREDEDFVFYNNMSTLDGAVRHLGDNRTGAGDGDDEEIHIDMNGIPFDVMKIMIVLSVYDEDFRGLHLQKVKNIFVRIVDEDDRDEIVRFQIPEEEVTTATAMRVAELVREGPRWYFSALAEPVVGGLGVVATEYDIIVQELASSNYDEV